MIKGKIKLFIIDNDPIFRLGLRTAIEKYADFEIIGEGNTSNDTFRELTQGLILNILVIGIALDGTVPENSGLQFCQKLRRLYPQLPIFLLIPDLKPRRIATIKSWGVRGYCHKSSSVNTVIEGLHSVAYGDFYWQEHNTPSGWLPMALSRVSRPGRQQIEDSLQEINEQLAKEDLSDWERVFLVGRKRELLAARWVANRLLAADISTVQEESSSLQRSPKGELAVAPPTALTPTPVFEDSAYQKIFGRIVTDIQLGLINRTKIPLEIDILQPQIQQDLLFMILERLSKTLTEIRQANSSILDSENYLRALWQWVANNFITKYYDQTNNELQEQLIEMTWLEFNSIKANIFNHIYSTSEVFDYLLGKPAFVVDNIIYKSDDSAAIARVELLLHNLIIQIANAVMQVVLNNFYDLEIFKYNLYNSEYKSTRAITSFRNDLSWRYRQEMYWFNPQNIFESRYCLFIVNNGRIKTLFIYAPRTEELEQLKGLPWLATIAIETRDAIAPRLRSLIALAGSAVVFILTQVIGKGLGLIGKGIIQGIGSTIKDAPHNIKNNKK